MVKGRTKPPALVDALGLAQARQGYACDQLSLPLAYGIGDWFLSGVLNFVLKVIKYGVLVVFSVFIAVLFYL